MTVRRSWTLWCDGCGEVLDDGTLGNETAAQARKTARANGAHVGRPAPGAQDVCAECWTEGVR